MAAKFKYPGPWKVMKGLVARMDTREPTVFDVGARYGNATAFFRRMWPNAMIYAFEPEPTGLGRLRTRFAKDSRFVVVPKALSHIVGTRTLYMGGKNRGASSLLTRPPAEQRQYHGAALDEHMQVDVTTLDRYTEEHSVERIHILSADVQGGEGCLLDGAHRMLHGEHIDVIYMEVAFVPLYEHARLFWEHCRMLDDYGYTLLGFYEQTVSKTTFQLIYADAIFISATVRRDVIDKCPKEWTQGKSLIAGM